MQSQELNKVSKELLILNIPENYSWKIHLGLNLFFALGAILVPLLLIKNFKFDQLLIIPGLLSLYSFAEWFAHKYILHAKQWFAKLLFQRHYEHHQIFTWKEMEFKSPKELFYILMPPYAINIIISFVLPLSIILSLFCLNLGLIAIITASVYYILYEGFHLICHLPKTSQIFKIPFLKKLTSLHTIHHHPKLFLNYNFNIIAPFWDKERLTFWKNTYSYSDDYEYYLSGDEVALFLNKKNWKEIKVIKDFFAENSSVSFDDTGNPIIMTMCYLNDLTFEKWQNYQARSFLSKEMKCFADLAVLEILK